MCSCLALRTGRVLLHATDIDLIDPFPTDSGTLGACASSSWGRASASLSCAALLLDAGHEVVVVTADPVERTTSALAAAVWFPTAAGPAEAVARWGASGRRPGRRGFSTGCRAW